MYLIRFQVGDRSMDGHEKCRDYYVTSSKPVQEVREAHHKAMREIWDLSHVCNAYGDNTVDLTKVPAWVRDYYDAEGETEVYLYSQDFADLWVEVLNRADPELNLAYAEFEDLQTSRADSQGRVLSTMGYGVFG